MVNGSRDIEPQEDGGEGIYLFCFARRNAVPAIEGPGLEERRAVGQWAIKDIVAVLTKVAIEPWTGPSAEANLKDLAWVGPRACRHEEVIQRVMLHSPVFPARFGTLFSSLERLEALSETHYDAISDFLRHTTGKKEWGIKGLLDRTKAQEEHLREALASHEKRLSSFSPGARYLEEQRIRSSTKTDLDSWLKGVCAAVADDLRRYASDFRERHTHAALSCCRAAGGDMDMVANWAFLIPAGAEHDFHACINASNTDHASRRLLFRVSGPWPPYSFAPALDVPNVAGHGEVAGG